MNRGKANKILKRLKARYGNISTDLSYKSLYQLTVAVVLSAQTTDKQVNSVTPHLFKKYPGFRQLAGGNQRDVENIIKSVGLYKTKAKNIINLSKTIVNQYKGKLPDSLEDLTGLPGIGRKSANVILNFGLKKAAFPVDTHVKRTARRIGFKESENPYKIEKALTAMIPEKLWGEAHLLLIRHGREICRARRPLCKECPITDLCLKSGVEDNIS